MCLAVPGRVIAIAGEDPPTRTGRVDFGGVIKEISLAFVPEARPGDHVLVHVGFAITVIDEEEARRVRGWLEEIEGMEAGEAESDDALS